MSTSKAEYLKKYLSNSEGDEKKKKRRKKPKASQLQSGFKIVDEDIGFDLIGSGNNVEEEEAPTVAEIIDERPDDVKQLEEYQNDRWKKLVADKPNKIRDNSQSSLRRHGHNSENSPPGRQRHDSDQSPPRGRHDSDKSPPTKQRYNSDQSPPRRQRLDSDQSPPRRQRHDSDQSPPSRHRHDSDQSPPRRKRHGSDQSPLRRQRLDSDQSPPRRPKPDDDLSPPRRKKPRETEGENKSKTLSGKIAGLSSAAEMKMEADKLKRKEREMFDKIDDSVLGKGAATVFRDKKTGKKRDVNAENQEDKEKAEEYKNKYDEWSKGLKQGTDESHRIQDMAHEMNKPLARHADDADLDSLLKDQEREGDPMLDFIKKKKSAKSKGPKYPQYKGPAPPPNRFNIRPGYRWDGVNRSNEFEKKYFMSLSNKKAIAVEAHKWSTEDM